MSRLVEKLQENKEAFKVGLVSPTKYVKGVFLDDILIDAEQGSLSDEKVLEGTYPYRVVLKEYGGYVDGVE